jgi:hypothetical protein
MVIVAATPKPVIDVEAVAEAVRRGPVTVQAGGKNVFIAVDPDDYRRLSAAARTLRGTEDDPVIRAARQTQRTAATAGLTEEELDRLLADES